MLKSCRATAVIVVIVLILVSAPLMAQEKRPVQVSLFTPIQIFPEGDAISGLRLNFLYGRSSVVTGLDLGLVNHTTSGVSKGWQWGLVGLVETDFVGFQDNGVNIVKGSFEGFQWGVVNYAHSANGFQLGLVNYAVNLKGLQVGLVNIIKQGGQFPVFPIVNWSF